MGYKMYRDAYRGVVAGVKTSFPGVWFMYNMWSVQCLSGFCKITFVTRLAYVCHVH